MRITFIQKLVYGFVVIVVLMAVANVITYLVNKQLIDSVHAADELAEHMEEVQVIKYLSMKQYQLQADMIINRDLGIIEEFEAVESERAALAKSMHGAMDHDDEKALYQVMADADTEFDRILSEELMPLLATEDPDIAAIQEIDGRSDAVLGEMIVALDGIDALIEEELTAAGADQDRLNGISTAVQLSMGGATIVLALVIAIALVIGVKRQVGIMVSTMAKVADGDLSQRVVADDSKVNKKDELMQISLSFDQLVGTQAGVIKQIVESAASVASSAEELSASAEETSKSVQEVAGTISEVAKGSHTTTTSVNESKENLTQNALAIEGIAKEIEEVASFASEASHTGEEGRRAADDAAVIITNAAKSVQETTGVVQALGTKTAQIGEFIGIITGIADQTNLLALNAAIEAARAGEAGRGFAVVAEEVRKLAEESNEAAGNITSLVKGIENEMQIALEAMNRSDKEVSAGASTVEATSQKLLEILTGIQSVTDRTQSVSAAAEEINASTAEVLDNISSVASVAEQNSAATQEVSSATEEQTAVMQEIGANSNNLARLAQEMQDLVAQFKV